LSEAEKEKLKQLMCKTIFILFFVIVAGSSTSLSGSPLTKDSLDKNIVKDISGEWLTFDSKSNSYVPYLKFSDMNTTLSAKINLEKYKGYNLNFIAAPGLSLFINNKIYYSNSSGKLSFVRFPLGSISQNEFQIEDLVTFYNPRQRLPEKVCYIGNNNKAGSIHKEKARVFQGVLKIMPSGNNIFMILFLIIIFLFGILKNKYPKKFLEFYDFSGLFKISSPEESGVLEIYSIPSILFILINAISCCLLLGIVGGEKLTLLGVPYASLNGVLIVAGIAVMIFVIRYIYLKLLGSVFNLQQLTYKQFFELVKAFLKLNLICVPITLVLFYSRSEILESGYQYFLYALIVCGLIVIIRISFLIFKYSNFRNIYLFSYLCATEILPLIIIIKVILF
jgi:Domain of unknown function (DUF4271)